MAHVRRRDLYKPIPKRAEIKTIGGKRFAHWVGSRGKPRKAPLSKDGKKIVLKASTYTIRFKDEHGKTCYVASGISDKAAAKQMAAQLETRASQIRQGLISPAEERYAKAAMQPIEQHLADYANYLRHKGNTYKHVRMTERRIRGVLEAGRIRSLSGLLESTVRGALDAIRTGPEAARKRSLGLETMNGYIRAIKGFSAWLHRDLRSSDLQLRCLDLFNAATDRRLERRAMSADELRWLFAVTQERTLARHRATGEDRAMCYLLAALTGYRAGELKSLTTACFDLDVDSPTINVQAKNSKRRKAERQPIPLAMVPKLKAWLAPREAGSRVFASIARDTARMLRSDLQAAREAWLAAADSAEERTRREQSDFLRYKDCRGHQADFHSLRTDYVTLLSLAGTDPKTLQTLARHSSIDLTMNIYNVRGQNHLAAPVGRLGEMLTVPPAANPARCPGDYSGDYSPQAPGGRTGQAGAMSPADRLPANEKPTKQNTPAKPGDSGASRGSSGERLRSESNRRWRICNPLP
jgi:integrase